MKKLLIAFISFLLIFNATASTDSTRTGSKDIIVGGVRSIYDPQLTGQFQFSVLYKFLDTTSIDKSPKIILPENWHATYSDLYGTTFS